LQLSACRSVIASLCFFLLISTIVQAAVPPAKIVVLQTDFGVKDSAVSEIKGVMYSVDKSLVISEVTQEIPPFNIWEAAYRLFQASAYWPKGTVFVSVVDPGVGTARKSIVALSSDGHYYVTPDNGTLTFIADNIGIVAVRQIDESKHRLIGSQVSYTFYGRDVYGYTAAKLAAAKITFEQVGPLLTEPLVKLNYQKALIKNQVLYGTIVILDSNYGNVWTNISQDLAKQFGLSVGKSYWVKIYYRDQKKYEGELRLHNTFGEQPIGAPLLYFNSLLNLSIALNQASFAQAHAIGAGEDWHIEISAKVNR